MQDAFGVAFQLPGVLAVHGVLRFQKGASGVGIIWTRRHGSQRIFIAAHHSEQRRRALKDLFQHGVVFVHWLILRQVFHDQLIRGQHLRTRVQINASQLRQKRGLANPIGANEPNLVAFIHRQSQILKQYALAEAAAQMSRLQKNHMAIPPEFDIIVHS